MANPWFRLYSKTITDTKLIAVTEALRWRYVALLCIQCNGEYETMPDDEIALALRITEEEWLSTKEIFIKRKLLDSDGTITSWEKLQYISDLKDPTAAERQKRYRDNKRNNRNATVTSRSPESDTDTDKTSKTNVRSSTSRFDEFWNIWPKTARKVAKSAAYKKWVAKKLDAIADQIIAHVDSMKKTKQWIDGFEPAPLTYINQGRWADEVFTGASGATPNTKPWYISSTGIESKGRELGIGYDRDEQFPAYKIRVYKAAGITPEMVRQANQDFGINR